MTGNKSFGQLVSTTIFLVLVLLLRAIFYNRISKRVCYAVWLVVGIYLLASFGEFSNSFQILNVFHVVYRAAETENGSGAGGQDNLQPGGDYGMQDAAESDVNAGEVWRQAQNNRQENAANHTDASEQENQALNEQVQSQTDGTGQNAVAPTAVSGAGQEKEGQVREKLTGERRAKELWVKELWLEGIWLKGIWIAGGMICAAVFAGSSLHFAKRLRKSRRLLETDGKFQKIAGRGTISVYQTEEISTPCLFGVVRPAIYLPKAQMEPDQCSYVLEHEYTHYRHGDHIWAVLRCLCIILYWYHPLVWLAALLSGRDSEFACDESVTRTYDTKERRAYGETLILFGAGGRDSMRLFTGASGMNGGKQELKKRITLIAARRKQHAGTAVLACILLLGVTGCTIGSPAVGNEGSEPGQESRNDENGEHTEEATQAVEKELAAEADGDLVPEPCDFARILKKTQENGIEYYNVFTEKYMPLPLNEWAKINIFTEQGSAMDAYVRFTQVIRDADEIREHINHYVEVKEIKEPFGMLETDGGQCVLLQYEILIAGDAKLEDNDRIPSMALDYPLRLYSTMESGRFENYQGIERSVCDLSILEQDRIEPGDTIRKEVICFIPREYTAYGMELAYMTAQRTTNIVYFKPEYE